LKDNYLIPEIWIKKISCQCEAGELSSSR